MKRNFLVLGVAIVATACILHQAGARGFGGGASFGGGRSFSGGGSWGGGDRSFSGYGGGERSWGSSGSFDRAGGSYSGWHTGDSYSGARDSFGGSTYDRSWTGDRGGSVTTEGSRGYVDGPRGAAAGSTRDTTVTGPDGRSYSGSTDRGAAVGPYGRTVGGATHDSTYTGPRGTVTSDWHSAYAGGHFSTDFGLSHYTSINGTNLHSTSYWSAGAMTTRAGYVRTGFGYYNCFRPGWYTAHPGCWFAAGWAAGAAWDVATWPSIVSYIGVPATPIDYDFGDTIVYQNDTVYVGGVDSGSAATYAQQAITIADKGQTAPAPPEQDWKPLGVFALVQGDEKTSNNIFQLAINKDGIIRGNFYDGVTDTTTPVYGSVDKSTQRAAWTIGKKKDRVFDAGIYNLTKDQAPVLVHLGTDRTQQWLLVRMQQPASGGSTTTGAAP